MKAGADRVLLSAAALGNAALAASFALALLDWPTTDTAVQQVAFGLICAGLAAAAGRAVFACLDTIRRG